MLPERGSDGNGCPHGNPQRGLAKQFRQNTLGDGERRQAGIDEESLATWTMPVNVKAEALWKVAMEVTLDG